MELSGFRHQVGGHFGLLQCQGHVAKPMNHRETLFYELMNESIRQFTPEYCGRIRVNVNSDVDGNLHLESDSPQCATPHPMSKSKKRDSKKIRFRVDAAGRVEICDPKASNYWAGACQSKVVQKILEGTYSWFILLENVVSTFSKPCILDLKLGTRQHGDDASETKRDRQLRKCKESTSAALGVRMVGMQLFDSDAKAYVFVDKHEGRQINKNQFYSHIHRYRRTCGRLRTESLKQKLREIRDVLEEANGYRFFSSSILIAFDAAQADTSAEDALRVHMIDFAHSTFMGFSENDITYDGPDEGYLLGLDSILAAMDYVPPLSPTSDSPTFEFSVDPVIS